MQIDIAFDYHIRFIPYRHQNTQVLPAAGRVAVDIEEVSNKDAPVVLRAADPKNRRFEPKQDGSPREVRYYRGMHMVESITVEEFVAAVRDDLEKTFFGKAKPLSKNRGNWGFKHYTAEEILRKQVKPMREFVDDKGKSVAEKLRELASKMIIVGGKVYEYTPEPVLEINSNGVRIKTRPPRRYVDDPHGRFDFHDYYLSSYYSSGTDVHANLRHASAILPNDANPVPYIEVVDASAFTFDATTYDCTNIADRLFNTLQAKAASLPWPLLDAFISLRDARDDAHHRITDRLIEAVSAIAGLPDDEGTEHRSSAAAFARGPKELLEMVRARADNRGAESVFQISRTIANQFLDRWAMRPPEAHWNNRVEQVPATVIGDRAVFPVLSEGHACDLAAAAGVPFSSVLTAVERGSTLLASTPTGYGSRAIALAERTADGVFRAFGEEQLAPEFIEHERAAREARQEQDMILSAPILGGM